MSGKVAAVTGGSRGIGFATAKALSENGAATVITAGNKAGLESAASKLDGAIPMGADIRKSDAPGRVIRQTVERFGRIDILVNNAGVFPAVKKTHEISDAEWDDVIDVNLAGQFRFARAAIPHLQKGGGVIVNI